jgi:hypothetical protein
VNVVLMQDASLNRCWYVCFLGNVAGGPWASRRASGQPDALAWCVPSWALCKPPGRQTDGHWLFSCARRLMSQQEYASVAPPNSAAPPLCSALVMEYMDMVR